MLKSNYEVEVVVHGKPLKEYEKDGKAYVEGREGTLFSIKIRNNSWQRKLFVPTVDGLSVMDGEVGGFESGGYIVGAYDSIEIKGWRTSDRDVAEFFFSGSGKSYSVRSGKGGGNIGVIGVAVVGEKVRYQTFNISQMQNITPAPWNPGYPYNNKFFCSSDDSVMCLSAQCCDAVNVAQGVGTGFGDRKESHVTEVSFDREGSPECVFQIFYNTREELKKLGIGFEKRACYVSPQAFPGKYCKPPQD